MGKFFLKNSEKKHIKRKKKGKEQYNDEMINVLNKLGCFK